MSLFRVPISFSFGRKGRAEPMPSHFVLELVKWQGATDARVEAIEKAHEAFSKEVHSQLKEISQQLHDVLIRLGPPTHQR